MCVSSNVFQELCEGRSSFIMDIRQQWLFLFREHPGHDHPRLSLHAASNDSGVFLFPQMFKSSSYISLVFSGSSTILAKLKTKSHKLIISCVIIFFLFPNTSGGTDRVKVFHVGHFVFAYCKKVIKRCF